MLKKKIALVAAGAVAGAYVMYNHMRRKVIAVVIEPEACNSNDNNPASTN